MAPALAGQGVLVVLFGEVFGGKTAAGAGAGAKDYSTTGTVGSACSTSPASRWRCSTETRARLDDSGRGRPEGVVVRSADRARIAEIRFEDDERTLRPARR